MRLLFDDGVVVTLEGPAEYELVSKGASRLHSGLLAATVPPNAKGFQVITPTAQVVDLGTAFGIRLDDDGESQVTVFDGEVEVAPLGSDIRQVISAGEAIRATHESQLTQMEFDTQAFEKVWPVSSGIAGSTGAFRFAPAWPVRLSQVQSDVDIFVVPEGYPTTLTRPLNVGHCDSRYLPTGHAIGGRADSRRSAHSEFSPAIQPRESRRGYWTSCSSPQPGPNGPGADLRRIVGEITFAQPILGIIVRTENLHGSDTQFSRTRDANVSRQLELWGGRLGDVLTLSQDRTTIQLDLAAVSRRYDHVRVIVNAPMGKPE